MIKLHWLDINSYEGSQPAHIIVDRSFDWRKLELPRYKEWGRDQLNEASSIQLSAAEPYWQFDIADFKRSCIASVASSESEFGTQLTESLFWCGWDSLGSFETDQGWDSGSFRLGGLPQDLSSRASSLVCFVPRLARDIDLSWAVGEFARGRMPIPVGRGAVGAWSELGFDYPPQLILSDTASVDDYHEAIWAWCETVDRYSVQYLYKKNLLCLIDLIQRQSQYYLLELDVPTWARNTLRLRNQFQRGHARLKELSRRVSALV